MGIGIDPMPTAFYATALSAFIKKIDAPEKTKKSLYEAMLRKLMEGESGRGALRQMRSIVYGVNWGWPEAVAFLSSVDGEPDEDELLQFLFERVSSHSHRLYRRGQIRSVLAANLGHWIKVSVSPCRGGEADISPCGRQDGETLQPTQDFVKSMPPCDALDCCCWWYLVYPDKNGV